MTKSRLTFQHDDSFTTPGGHTYYRATTTKFAGFWAIADGSSTMPWNTDDGTLFVKPDQLIEVGAERIALHLLSPDGETSRAMLSPAEALLVAVKLGLGMTVGQGRYRVFPSGNEDLGDLVISTYLDLKTNLLPEEEMQNISAAPPVVRVHEYGAWVHVAEAEADWEQDPLNPDYQEGWDEFPQLRKVLLKARELDVNWINFDADGFNDTIADLPTFDW